QGPQAKLPALLPLAKEPPQLATPCRCRHLIGRDHRVGELATAQTSGPGFAGELRVAPGPQPVVANLEGEAEQPARGVETLRHGARRSSEHGPGSHGGAEE